jgi:hypothetical protein
LKKEEERKEGRKEGRKELYQAFFSHHRTWRVTILRE